jgi:NO-binding membrane sensor protein with MHYT domain
VNVHTRRWKKYITKMQIWQFITSFIISFRFWYLHLTTETGCAGPYEWTFNFVFNVIMLSLFIRFSRRTYGKKPDEKAE